jgi:hypothetical protein
VQQCEPQCPSGSVCDSALQHCVKTRQGSASTTDSARSNEFDANDPPPDASSPDDAAAVGCGPTRQHCDINAACQAGDSGKLKCVCLSGYRGDGESCETDACRKVSCDDPNSQCMLGDGGAECRCRNGFVGQPCMPSDSCASSPCEHEGKCARSGAGFACDCEGTGFAGARCDEPLDHCDPNSCQHGGTCTGTARGVACGCDGTGHIGERCELDPCSPSPCDPGFKCVPNASGADCVACRDVGCGPGDACASDGDCRTGGDSRGTCDPTAHVCLGTCEGAIVTSKDELDKLRYCSEIDGTLDIREADPCFTIALPYLRRVRGWFPISSGATNGNVIQPVKGCPPITLPSLEIVDNSLRILGDIDPPSLDLPKLVQCENFEAYGDNLESLRLPSLKTVSKAFELDRVAHLRELVVPQLEFVAQVRVKLVCRLPYSSLQPLLALESDAVGSYSEDVGCCVAAASEQYGCGGDCVCR